MEYIILFIFTINFIFSYLKTRDFSFSLLFNSVLLSFSDFSHLAILLLLVSIFVCVINKKVLIQIIDFLYYIILLIMIVSLFSLSSLNGATTSHILGKASRVAIILFFMLSHSKFSYKTILENIQMFILTSIVSIPALYYMNYYDDLGYIIYRISSFLNDPNYLALCCLVFIIFCHMLENEYSIKVKNIKYLLFILMIISQSWNVIGLFFLYLLVKRSNKVNKILKILNPIIPFIVIITILFLLESYGNKLQYYNDWNESEISLKLNSVFIRINTIINAYHHMQDNPLTFYFGMGSGRALEIGERVFHNLYFQQFFDHGWIFYILFQTIIGYLIYTRFSSYYHNIVIFLLMFNNLLFDNFYSFLFSISIIIFSIHNKGNTNE